MWWKKGVLCERVKLCRVPQGMDTRKRMWMKAVIIENVSAKVREVMTQTGIFFFLLRAPREATVSADMNINRDHFSNKGALRRFTRLWHNSLFPRYYKVL